MNCDLEFANTNRQTGLRRIIVQIKSGHVSTEETMNTFISIFADTGYHGYSARKPLCDIDWFISNNLMSMSITKIRLQT